MKQREESDKKIWKSPFSLPGFGAAIVIILVFSTIGICFPY